MDLPLVLLFVVAVAVTLMSRWRGWPAPLALLLTGCAASYVPGLPDVDIEPHVVLTVVLPPLLYAAANEVFYLDLRAVMRPVLVLGVALVAVTTVVVGFVAQLVVPSLTMASAMVLGAVVSPPDAVSTAAIGRQAGLPRRLMNILSGESLINDATALTLLTVSLAAATGETTDLMSGIEVFVVAVVAGVAIGLAIAWCAHTARLHISDAAAQSLVSLSVPFLAYLVAEELHGSGVLAVVAAGLYLGHMQPHAAYSSRLHEEPLWASINLMLEAGVFLLIGMQLRDVVDVVSDVGVGQLVVSGLAVTVAAIAIRPMFLFFVELLRRLPFVPLVGVDGPLPWRQNLVLSWAGMRGVVTLAAAAAIPTTTLDGAPFPGRQMIQYLAFVLTVATLLVQGLTLPRMIRRLGIADLYQARRDRRAEAKLFELMRRETAERLDLLHAELVDDIGQEAADQVIDDLHSIVDPYRSLATYRTIRFARHGNAPQARARDERFARRQLIETLRRDVLAARRAFVIAERDAGRLDETVMRSVLRALDLEEARQESFAETAGVVAAVAGGAAGRRARR